MSAVLRVLIVEDSENDALLLLRELKKGGFEPDYEQVQTSAAMQEALIKREWDIVISDYVMPQFSGLAALKLLQDNDINMPFIIVSGNIGEDIAVEAMRAGAHDYILKGNYARLVPAIKRELEEAQHRRERKKAELGLRESEARNSAILNAIPDLIFRVSKDGVFLDYRAEEQADLYMKPEEFIGHNVNEVMPDSISHKVQESIKKVLETNSKVLMEYQLEVNNKLRIYEAKLVHCAENEVLAIVRDITDRKKIEQELLERNELLQLVMDNIPQFIFWKDTQYLYLGCNKNFALHVGTTDPKDIVGKSDNDLDWERGDAEAFKTLDKKALETDKAILHVEMVRKMGNKKGWVDVSKVPMHDAEGKVVGVLGVYEDITDRKLAELEVQERRSREIEIQAEAEKAKREFYKGTIFSVTDGKLNLATYDEINSILTEDAKYIRLGEQKDLTQLRRDITDLCNIVEMDEDQTYQLIIAVGEAATNAIKHASGGIARIGLKDKKVQVCIQDRGTGMDTLILPKATLMSRFSTKPSMGLGYSLILASVDTVFLATDTKGTWILMEKSPVSVAQEINLYALPDSW